MVLADFLRLAAHTSRLVNTSHGPLLTFMSFSRKSRSLARLSHVPVHVDDQETKCCSKSMQGNISHQNHDCCSSGELINRKRSSLEQIRSCKSLKIECLTPDIKNEGYSEANSIIDSRKKYQNILQEVYLYGSFNQSDTGQSGSPKTPTLKDSSAQAVSRFMESFACAFPSECDDLMALLDTFMERR